MLNRRKARRILDCRNCEFNISSSYNLFTHQWMLKMHKRVELFTLAPLKPYMSLVINITRNWLENVWSTSPNAHTSVDKWISGLHRDQLSRIASHPTSWRKNYLHKKNQWLGLNIQASNKTWTTKRFTLHLFVLLWTSLPLHRDGASLVIEQRRLSTDWDLFNPIHRKRIAFSLPSAFVNSAKLGNSEIKQISPEQQVLFIEKGGR